MPYRITIGKRDLEISDCDKQGHYNVFWQDLPIGFVYRLELGIDVGNTVWAGSSPFLNRHVQDIGLYIEQSNI